ncbi:LOW QUALITY PROTEIN: hypothetical protein PanWU01x14_175770 [Parasponia andersonii]|uniref:Uncharacterized protein n=1 Tax=Parasponia andersonii TaxID=3476 RepID=A0A2P5C808_PARAD|nr:LOW QUALITY PROTEIN: hypothetical protein PanWU01x14_175770 [Parasponia andersonii]
MSLHFLGVWRGNFNSIFYMHKRGEKKKKTQRVVEILNSTAETFKMRLLIALLTDLGYVSEMMAWNNGYEEDMITERLDRVLYGVELLGLFLFAQGFS